MSNQKSNPTDLPNEVMKYAWGKYREYAATSRAIKKTLSGWRYRVLLLGIGGAVFGVLCQESIRLELDTYWEYLSGTLGGISALLIAIAAYFGKELVSSESERNWIRSRSMAEALKSQCFLYVTGSFPYNQPNKDKLLQQQTDDLLVKVKDIVTGKISEDKKIEKILPNTIDIKQYMTLRVDDQIKYYADTSKDYTLKMKTIKNIGLILGLVAVVFGVLGTTGWTAGWIAVISTITSSVVAYAYANRFQYLIISYQATGNRLENLKAGWYASKFTDTHVAEKNEFVIKCEEAVSIENSAWMAELVKKVA